MFHSRKDLFFSEMLTLENYQTLVEKKHELKIIASKSSFAFNLLCNIINEQFIYLQQMYKLTVNAQNCFKTPIIADLLSTVTVPHFLNF